MTPPPDDSWRAPEGHSCGAAADGEPAESPRPVRLLSVDGASFALLPVPSLLDAADAGTCRVDIELLTPDRLVRYLDRPMRRSTPARLAEMFMRAASETYPEQSVPSVQDDDAGLALLVGGSDPFGVMLEVIVVADLEEEVPDRDGIAFDVPRTALIDAAHALEGWSA